jgi:hypothetical protein
MIDEILESLKGKVPYIVAGIAAGYYLRDIINDLQIARLMCDTDHDYGISDDKIIKAPYE